VTGGPGPDPGAADSAGHGPGAGAADAARHRPGAADSAGRAWAGRTLTDSGFAGDTGGADRAVEAALAAWERERGPQAEAAVVAALAASRVLVPVVAVRTGQESAEATGLLAETSTDMALVTVTTSGGRRALPVFGALAALQAWDAAARPVPVDTPRAALSAAAEGCDVLLLDPAGPRPFLVRRPAVEALARGRVWQPAALDAEVARAVGTAAAADPRVTSARVEPGAPAEVRVVLALVAGLDRAGLDDVVAGVGRRLAASAVVAQRVDSLELKVVAAG
jgi:SseB protein N-terminal domain